MVNFTVTESAASTITISFILTTYNLLNGIIPIKSLIRMSGYHADTPITIKAEASSKADSRPN